MITIKIADQYSRTPRGRHISDGPFSGEQFRDRFLVPALTRAAETSDKVVVILDGTRYLSSFLDEAFGGLVRVCGFTKDQLALLLEIQALDPSYEVYGNLAWCYISNARAERPLAS
jgi:STAS-like domain of unknown function (DUF4325)